MRYFYENAKISDVISWTMASPALLIGLICCPYVISIYPKFENMFASLNAKLPYLTVFYLSNGWWFCSFVPFMVCLVMIFGLIKFKNSPISIIFAAGGLIIVWGILSSEIVAIFLPILELQRNLN